MYVHGQGKVVRATAEAEAPAAPSSGDGVAAKMVNLPGAERSATEFAVALAYGVVLQPA